MYKDYHTLYANLIADTGPLPYIDELFPQRRGVSYFSNLFYVIVITKYQDTHRVGRKQRLFFFIGYLN